MSKFDWFRRLTFPNGGHPSYDQPGSIEIDGRPFVVATNGYALTAVEGESDFGSASIIEQAVGGWYRELHEHGARIDFASLKEWAGKPSIMNPSDCTTCGGTQKVTCTECNGSRRMRCMCPHCDDEHDAECYACSEGTEPCPDCTTRAVVPIRPGIVDGWPFNLELIARYTAGIEAKTALLHIVDRGDRGELYLGNTDWFVAVMGLRGVDLETVTERWNSKEAVVAS